MSEELDFDFAELWPIGELIGKLPPAPRGQRATSWVYHQLNLSNDPNRRTLHSVLVGRYRYCCDRWLKEFLQSSKPGKPTPTPGQRDRRRDRAKKELAKAGI